MDKKSLLGLLIIGVILFGFTLYTGNQQKKVTRKQAIEDSIYRAQNPVVPTTTPKRDSIALESVLAANDSVLVAQKLATENAIETRLGVDLFQATKGEEKEYVVETELVKMTFSNKGGRVSSVELKNYSKYGGGPLILFDKESAIFDLSFFIRKQSDAQIHTKDYVFKTDAPEVTVLGENEDQKTISMKLYVDSLSYVEYLYTIHNKNYMIDFDVNFIGMEDLFSNQSEMLFTWETATFQNEKGFDNENTYTTLGYMFPAEKSMDDLGMSKNSKSETINNNVHWVAFKQQFFSSVFIADGNFQNSMLSFDTFAPNSGYIKKFHAELSVPFSATVTNYKHQFYYGPNKYSILKKYDANLEKLVPLGWGIFGWVNRWFVIPVFDFLCRIFGNLGLAILLLTIIVKIAISPLTYKSYLSTAKMRLLKPKIDEMTAKFTKPEDAMKKQQATMELYKKAGVSPMGGCMPMLIQFPILIALFRFFPSSIELRGESFLWADDLSSYDAIINLPFNVPFYGSHVSLFALLMAVSIFVSSKINFAQTASSTPQMPGMKFMMLYLMPVMMLFWFNNYASGLCYYYFLSTLITVGLTYAFRYIVNEDKLMAKMKENAKKPIKKSKFQLRYDEMLKQQQQKQRKK